MESEFQKLPVSCLHKVLEPAPFNDLNIAETEKKCALWQLWISIIAWFCGPVKLFWAVTTLMT